MNLKFKDALIKLSKSRDTELKNTLAFTRLTEPKNDEHKKSLALNETSIEKAIAHNDYFLTSTNRPVGVRALK